VIDDLFDAHHPAMFQNIYQVHAPESSPTPRKCELLKPRFACSPADTIKRTLTFTTQYSQGLISDTIRQHWKPRFHACNVKCYNEAVATNTIFCDTPAVDNGAKAAQLFVELASLVADEYARVVAGTRIKEILLALIISDWQSEPYQQNQNFAENRYATIKTATSSVLNL
jgi:hypothetical protein